MTELIELKTGNPQAPRPPDFKGAFHGMELPLHKANCLCVALRELLSRQPADCDEYLIDNKRQIEG